MFMHVDYYDFERAFRDCGREDNFSSDGLAALFRYIEELEEDTGEQCDLDPIELCCDHTEYSSALEAAADYNGPTDTEMHALEWLEERTEVIRLENSSGVIIVNF